MSQHGFCRQEKPQLFSQLPSADLKFRQIRILDLPWYLHRKPQALRNHGGWTVSLFRPIFGCLVKPIVIQPLDELQQMERNISVSMYVDDGVDGDDDDDDDDDDDADDADDVDYGSWFPGSNPCCPLFSKRCCRCHFAIGITQAGDEWLGSRRHRLLCWAFHAMICEESMDPQSRKDMVFSPQNSYEKLSCLKTSKWLTLKNNGVNVSWSTRKIQDSSNCGMFSTQRHCELRWNTA